MPLLPLWAQVLALQVLDECQNVSLSFALVAHHGGDLGPTQPSGGLVPSVSSDQLIADADSAHDDGLQEPMRSQAVGELGDVTR